MAKAVPMNVGTFSLTSVSGAAVKKLDAGGSLLPCAYGWNNTTPTGVSVTQGAARPHLRLIK